MLNNPENESNIVLTKVDILYETTQRPHLGYPSNITLPTGCFSRENNPRIIFFILINVPGIFHYFVLVPTNTQLID